MSDTQKHPPVDAAKKRAAGRPRGADGRLLPQDNSRRAQEAGLHAQLDKAHAVSNDRLDKLTNAMDWLEGTRTERDEAILQRDQLQATLGEEIRLITQGRDRALAELESMRESMKRGGDATVRYEQEQRKHLNNADDQLKIVSDLLGIPPIPVHGQSIDDWGSDLRDAYDKAMRQDAETLYARDIAERDDYANQLADTKTKLERLSAMTLFARLRWALAGGDV